MKARIISLILMLALAVGMLASCGNDGSHEHQWGDWEKGNATKHSHTCAICGETVSEEHDFKLNPGQNTSLELLKYTCSICGKTKVEENTSFDPWVNERNEAKIPWESDTLIYHLTKNTNHNELSSGCESYLAGVNDGSNSLIGDVVQRNNMAMRRAKVTIEYQYFEATDINGGWGYVKGAIEKLNTGAGSSAPDMYCDLLNDMNGAAYTGSFKNILEGRYLKENYFSFLSEYYNPGENDRGYMWDFMQTLTMSKNRMYLIASDYYIDLIRAMFVLPAGVDILTGAACAAVTGDVNEDGIVGDADDFLALVQNKQFTWAKVAEYSEAVSTVNTATNVVDGCGNSIVGIVFDDQTGMDKAAFLYASNVQMLAREEVNGDWKYTFNQNPDTLYSIGNQLNELFATKGFIGVCSKAYNGNTQAKNGKAAGDTDYIPACKTILAEGRAVFAGPLMLGAIEDETLQSLWDEASNKHGFIVCPIPMFEGMTDYNTCIHNVGRLGAIASATTKFTKCSAYLDYQCTNSSDILEDFYTWSITIGKAQGTDANVSILSEMRNQLTNTIDKVVEDLIYAVGCRPDVPTDPPFVSITATGETQAMGTARWHELIASGATLYADAKNIRAGYEAIMEQKQYWLDKNLLNYGIPGNKN